MTQKAVYFYTNTQLTLTWESKNSSSQYMDDGTLYNRDTLILHCQKPVRISIACPSSQLAMPLQSYVAYAGSRQKDAEVFI